MPHARPRIAPASQPAIEIRRYGTPPANDRFDAAAPSHRPQAGTTRTYGRASGPGSPAKHLMPGIASRARTATKLLQYVRAKDAIDYAREGGEHDYTYLEDPLGEIMAKYTPGYFRWVYTNIYRKIDPIVWESAVAVTPAGRYIDLIKFGHELLSKQTTARPKEPVGWSLIGRCFSKGSPNGWVAHGPGITYANQCLGLQAGTEIASMDADPLALGVTHALWNSTRTKYTHILNYTRANGVASATTTHRFHPSHRLNAHIVPNVMRAINLTPQPLGITAPSQALAPEPSPLYQRAVEISIGARPRAAPAAFRASRSQPAEPNVKERKGKAGQLGAALFKALDVISEGSEVVDAFYQALPQSTRTEWGRRNPKKREDNQGQYGLGGAEWKGQALYHNWHKVDFGKAIKNVLANELEDRLYGAAHKARGDLTFRGRKRPRRRNFG